MSCFYTFYFLLFLHFSFLHDFTYIYVFHFFMFTYRPFHKTLPKSSLRIHLISVRFYEMGDISYFIKPCRVAFLNWISVRFYERTVLHLHRSLLRYILKFMLEGNPSLFFYLLSDFYCYMNPTQKEWN